MKKLMVLAMTGSLLLTGNAVAVLAEETISEETTDEAVSEEAPTEAEAKNADDASTEAESDETEENSAQGDAVSDDEISPYRACEHTNSYKLAEDSHEATDTEGGLRHYVCSECGAEYSYQTDPLVYETNPKTGEPADQSGSSNPLLPSWEYVPDGEPHVFWSRDDEEWRVYLYGSHDKEGKSMCSAEQVLWSAPVYDLSDWRYEGVILDISEGNTYGGNMLFAPDAEYDVTTDTYYMVSSQVFENSVLRSSTSPAGPWDPDQALLTIPIKNSYDPSLYIEDGTIYMAVSNMTSGYADNEEISKMVEEDNYTTGMKHVASIYKLDGNADDGYEIAETTWCPTDERGFLPIFEGPSLTGYVDELGAYVLLYVSYEVGADGAFYNSAISYVWTDDLMNGTWHYGFNGIDNDVVGYDTSVLVSGDHGNVISDTSGRYVKNQETGEMEFTDFATYISGNNHGGMAKVNGKWYFFGHRQTNASNASRQAIVGQIGVGPAEDGSPVITPMELTSCGAADSMDAFSTWNANTTTYLLEAVDHPAPSTEGDNVHSDCLVNGPYVVADRDQDAVHTTCVTNLKDGNIVGYKYLDFGDAGTDTLKMLVSKTADCADGSVDLYLDAPSEDQGGTLAGTLELTADAVENAQNKEDGSNETSWSWLKADCQQEISGVHAVYFVFHGEEGKMICSFDQFGFERN